ncbi:MAG TPA: helix-turn-helix domain-containing protein [Puia sp.]|nr:helix-turn-helix domain-containing protein [Puia sp.]
MIIDLLTKNDLEEFRKSILQEIVALLKEKMPETKQWMKSSEVQKLLKVSAGKLQSLRINGTLKASKIGGTNYYKYDEILKMLENNRRD